VQIRNGRDPAYNEVVNPPPDDEGTPPQAGQADLSAEAERKVRFLSNHSSYPGHVSAVEPVETHFAWVFLTDEHAWKMKKAIRAQVIDYRRLEDREYYCREELRLNRRLADWVYLDLVPLTEDAEGHLRLGGDGRAVDWLVKMRRLDEEWMLDRLIERGSVGDDQLERTARHLAAFHAGLPPEPLEAEAYRSRLLAQIDEQRRHLEEIDDALTDDPWPGILDDQCRYLRTHGPEIDARAEAGRIVEAHGDLRPEHVYLGERFAIIDCLEFSRDLRVQDSAEEMAFLALECEREGERDLRDRLLVAWQAASGDTPQPSLMAFYFSRRAMVRAVLSAWHLEDPSFDRDHYIGEARRYIGRAREFIDEALSG
jgi:aminoglycoside phosphotransferase family enzyme